MTTKTYTVRTHEAAKPARQLSRAAQAAKMIRQTLKAAFPTVTFRVKSRGFAGGDAVDITWTDGPTSKQIEALVSQHEQGHFDGMQDLYEYSNVRKDFPQAKYVQTQRSVSDAATLAAVAYLNKHYGYTIETIAHEATKYSNAWVGVVDDAMLPTNRWPSMEVNSTCHHTSMICRHCGAHTLPGDAFCPDCGNVLGCDDCKRPFGYLQENHNDTGLCWSCAYNRERKAEETAHGEAAA